MTKILILVGLTVTVLGSTVFGQGSIAFANTTTTRVTMAPEAGSVVPFGNRFQAELMFHPDTTVSDVEFEALAQRQGLPTTFNVTPAPGTFNGGGRTVATTSPGGIGRFQVRVWESAAGVDYRTAMLSGRSDLQAGKSAVFSADTADVTAIPLPLPAPLGMPAFQLSMIPEPSVIGLGLLGAGALLLRRM